MLPWVATLIVAALASRSSFAKTSKREAERSDGHLTPGAPPSLRSG